MKFHSRHGEGEKMLECTDQRGCGNALLGAKKESFCSGGPVWASQGTEVDKNQFLTAPSASVVFTNMHSHWGLLG